MNLPRFALDHRPVVLAFVAVFLAAGLLNFTRMSRREDPEITIRDALVIVSWPGAPAGTKMTRPSVAGSTRSTGSS